MLPGITRPRWPVRVEPTTISSAPSDSASRSSARAGDVLATARVFTRRVEVLQAGRGGGKRPLRLAPHDRVVLGVAGTGRHLLVGVRAREHDRRTGSRRQGLGEGGRILGAG